MKAAAKPGGAFGAGAEFWAGGAVDTALAVANAEAKPAGAGAGAGCLGVDAAAKAAANPAGAGAAGTAGVFSFGIRVVRRGKSVREKWSKTA